MMPALPPAWVWVAGLALATLVFTLWPGLDLAVSARFYDGSGFPVATDPLIEGIRRFFYAAEDVLGVLAFLLALWTRRRGPLLGQGARIWLYQGLIFVLGPLLLVNGVLKPLWARPRPDHLIDFGGALPFQPIWQIGGLCTRSCSFTSGEMAGAVALSLMGVMLVRANQGRMGPAARRLALALALLPVPFTAWQRIAAGRHFLSDVTFSALLVGLIASLLAQAMLHPRRP